MPFPWGEKERDLFEYIFVFISVAFVVILILLVLSPLLRPFVDRLIEYFGPALRGQ